MKATEQKPCNTNTTRFILPLLKVKKKDVMTGDFIGSYMRTDYFPEEENALILVYKAENDIIQSLTDYSLITKEGYHLYVKKPSTYLLKDSIEKLMKGSFSKLTSPAKMYILDFWGLDKSSRLAAILYPSSYAFEIGISKMGLGKIKEIWPAPNVENETFKYAK